MKILIVLTLITLPLFSHAVSAEQVLQSSFNHYPKILETLQSLEEEKANLKEAKGVFDAELESDIHLRTSGYYGGDSYQVKVVKPLPYMNSQVYTGKRQGYGEFPVYDGELATLNQGEIFAGASLSLLRDSLIDSRRYLLRVKKQEVLKAQLKIEVIQIQTQTMALKAYWTWVINGRILQVYKNLLNLGKKRQLQIARRIKVGDLAQIYKTENDQYIQKRQAQVLQSEMEFRKSSFYLSLFYRNSKGQPIVVTERNLPNSEVEIASEVPTPEEIYQQALRNSLQLKILEIEENKANLAIRKGSNRLLPKLDLAFEWKQDQGTGPANLRGEENRVFLKVNIPIENRTGRGQKRAGQAKAGQVKVEKKWVKDQLKAEVASLVVNAETFKNIFSITKQQVRLAHRLVTAEFKKFDRGASDLILVNLREENLAESQVKNLLSFLKFKYNEAEINNLRVEFLVKPTNL